MRAKDGVDLKALSAPAWWAAHLADQLHHQYTGQQMVVTSTNEGKHSVERSAHYTGDFPGYGRAFDMRVWYLDDPEQFTADLVDELGDDYVVLLEYRSDGKPSHIHVHWGPIHRDN